MKRKDFIVGTLLMIGFLAVVGLVGGWESKYTKEATCIGYAEGVYTFVDSAGDAWMWESEQGEDFNVNETYVLVMDDNHSINNLQDDWIYKIKKVEKGVDK